MTRPTWDTYFMRLARVVSERSTCDRARVGCVLARDKRMLTAGYNGSPPGFAHCDDAGHIVVNEHCIRTTHAEINALVQAALHGVSTDGFTCYVTHHPCLDCTKALLTAGVRRVVFEHARNVSGLAERFFKEAGVEVEQWEDDEPAS
jgi:dCMP deaminase